MLTNGARVKNLVQVKTLLRRVMDTLLPNTCLACDTPVEADGQFCLPCFRRASFISEPCCRCCGVPLPFAAAADAAGLCGRCAAAPPAFGRARAALRYDETAQKLILPFKYADRTELARGLAKLMLRPGAAMLAAADALVPVPLHVSRLRQRRYNQAALLAGRLARLTGLPCLPDALVRHRATAALARMGLEARQVELRDAIAVRPGFDAAGRALVLVDDVMTSGTTADACAAALLAAGAKRVDVLTAARVADPRLEP
jgi:ComF family protein